MGEKEYIEREALLAGVDAEFFKTDPSSEEQLGVLKCRRIIRELPAADVAPVVHGEWVIKTDYETPVSHAYVRKEKLYICLYCGKDYRQHMNFCGNCGVKMDGGKEATP